MKLFLVEINKLSFSIVARFCLLGKIYEISIGLLPHIYSYIFIIINIEEKKHCRMQNRQLYTIENIKYFYETNV